MVDSADACFTLWINNPETISSFGKLLALREEAPQLLKRQLTDYASAIKTGDYQKAFICRQFLNEVVGNQTVIGSLIKALFEDSARTVLNEHKISTQTGREMKKRKARPSTKSKDNEESPDTGSGGSSSGDETNEAVMEAAGESSSQPAGVVPLRRTVRRGTKPPPKKRAKTANEDNSSMSSQQI